LRERRRRNEAVASLTSWCEQIGFHPAAHQRLIIEKLEAVSRGEIKRLGLFLPPGSAKSTYASILYPPWHLSKHPEASIIAASHTAELAEKWGRKVRNLVSEHQETLEVAISDDNKAAGRWETSDGGEYFAAGVGGSITGRRADLAIIDDPIRSREDADSLRVRTAQWDWYQFDLLTRLKPNAAIVLIQTRWHEDDLAGRILATESGWDVVSIPMEAEPNDPLGRPAGSLLWPEWFTPEMLAQAKRDTRVWSALYQQRPTPEEGAYFKADWLRPCQKLPPRESLYVYGASDYAVTDKGGDYTVHIVIGIDPDDRLYVLDLWRGQTDSFVWIEAWCDLVKKWEPMEWAEEGGQIRGSVGPFLERMARERRAYTFRRQFPSKVDKATRAQSMRGRMAMGGLYLPMDAPWRAAFESEILRFPAGVHDDQVDALGLLGMLLDVIQAPMIPEAEKKRDRTKRRDWFADEDEDDDMAANWKTA